jgi:hypothetical protein
MGAWKGWLFLGAVATLTTAACGSSVTFDEGEGGSGSIGNGGTGSTPDCSIKSSCNPPACPIAPPLAWDTCPVEGLECFYQDGACEIGFVCEGMQSCWDGAGNAGPGSSGSGGDCEILLQWQHGDATCTQPPVACSEAQDGDPCAFVGESCGEGYDCGWTDKYCQEDHTWSVSEYFDDCSCEPYYCPPTLPESGQLCDPCYDSSYCEYVVDSPCGPLIHFAGCDELDWTWYGEGEECLGGGGGNQGNGG